jgi:hypothetical protein
LYEDFSGDGEDGEKEPARMGMDTAAITGTVFAIAPR